MEKNKVEFFRNCRVGIKKCNGIFLVQNEKGLKEKFYLELKEEEILLLKNSKGELLTSSIIQSNEEYEAEILRMEELLFCVVVAGEIQDPETKKEYIIKTFEMIQKEWVVKTENLEEAIKMVVNDTGKLIPISSEYVGCSFEIDAEGLLDRYPNEVTEEILGKYTNQ